MSKHNKTPRVVKTKEQLLEELKKSADWMKKMHFTKEIFYPALVKASHSVDDAGMFLSSLSTMIMQEFLALMKERKFGEMNLSSKLDSKDTHYREYVELVELFNDFTIFDTKELIEGMKNELNLFVAEEMKVRALDSLKTKWIDE